MKREGYIFLISVLVIGAIASTTAISLVLLGLSSDLTGLSVAQSAQSYQLAHTCVERALRSLRADLTYAGDETLTLTGGSCNILSVPGGGNAGRAICAEGQSNGVVRRLEVDLAAVYPAVRVSSWQEVSTFTLCP